MLNQMKGSKSLPAAIINAHDHGEADYLVERVEVPLFEYDLRLKSCFQTFGARYRSMLGDFDGKSVSR